MKLQLIVWVAAAAALLWSPCGAGEVYKLKLQRCRQSSTQLGANCERAFDGNSNQNFSHGSCSQVGNEGTGWWQATIERPAIISKVQIYNRQDCCADVLTKFQIIVDRSVCHTYEGEPFGQKTFDCPRRGTNLKITSQKANLTLCEVNVFGKDLYDNIKLSRCNQSSTYETYSCDKAIDGNSDQNVSHGSCSQVIPGTNGWWQAEIDRPALINIVQISKNDELGDEEFIFFNVTVDGQGCIVVIDIDYNRNLHLCHLKGTVLRISNEMINLSFCEINALGHYLDSELKLSTCQQSSTFGNNTCEKAIDGNAKQNFSQGSCSQVGDERTGWWQAETERPALIKLVQIYNRQDCCSERLTKFEISVDGSVCHKYDGEPFGAKMFNCSKRGTHLKISSSKASLTLCEVKVFGGYLDNKIRLATCSYSATRIPQYEAICGKVMDGRERTCIKLGGSEPSWWQAGTDGDVLFEFVRIINNPECCLQSLTQMEISVDGSVCYEYNGNRFSDKSFRCFKTGTVLKVSSNKPGMAICEVTVIGNYLDRQLKLRNCSQSYTDNMNNCNSAIDGVLRTTMILGPLTTIPNIESAQGWWQAHTERPALIKWVNIYSAGYCCEQGFRPLFCCYRGRKRVEISVDGHVCYTYTEFDFTHGHFRCFARGSLLRIYITRSTLKMTEVTAFGHYLDDV